MFREAHDVPAGGELTAGICIVGSGPAGLTLARELAGHGLDVLVLESGGREAEPERSKALTAGDTTGDVFKPLCSSRLRQLGGTANLWDTQVGEGRSGFRGAPLDPVDLEPRDWLPHYPGWPFGREELDPYMERAHRVCYFGPYAYDGADWERPGTPRLPTDPAVLTTTVWQFGDRQRMLADSREIVERSPNLEVLLHATVVEIETNETASAVRRLHVARPDGARFTVAAERFVLAMGGIDNARLLLLTDRVQPRGLGNAHDLVGRFFMEHQQVRIGDFVPVSRDVFGRLGLYDQRVVDGTQVMGQLQLTAEAMRRERLLNLSVALVPRRRGYHRVSDEAVRSFETLVGSAARLRLPDGAGAHLRRVLGHLDYVAAASLRRASRLVTGRAVFEHLQAPPDFITLGGWSERPDPAAGHDLFELLLHTEQAPHPDNRITLGEGRDPFGLRTPVLHWEWRRADTDSLQRAQHLIARALERTGLGRVRLHAPEGRPTLIATGLHHHMGTTRMHPDPRQGVVDAHGRVHGVANLWVAGCSVFPTGGFINPTLTIVALAIRLADRLTSARPLAPAIATAAGAAGVEGGR